MKESVTLDQCKPLPKASKPLQRIDRVHRTFERQMGVKTFEQHHCLIDDSPSLPFGQRFGPEKELIQSDAGSK
jgi:hypothetical protein